MICANELSLFCHAFNVGGSKKRQRDGKSVGRGHLWIERLQLTESEHIVVLMYGKKDLSTRIEQVAQYHTVQVCCFLRLSVLESGVC